MHVWDGPSRDSGDGTISGQIFGGLGMRAIVERDSLFLLVGDVRHAIAGAGAGGRLTNYQCNQLAIVITGDGQTARVYLGNVLTKVAGLDIQTVRAALEDAPAHLLTIGSANAKIWDVRLYGGGLALTAAQVGEIGKRCGAATHYRIPLAFPNSNYRYSYGMGGTKINPNSESQHFSSGVYVTLWIPEGDTWPPVDADERDNLRRMVGFWDRWHEQVHKHMHVAIAMATRMYMHITPRMAAHVCTCTYVLDRWHTSR